MREHYQKLIDRMKSIGIEIEMTMNYPWYYLERVNGKRVKETCWAQHGFTAFLGKDKNPVDLSYLFEIIRRYL